MGTFNFQEFLSAFIVLFAVIDIIGSIPIILDLKQKGRSVNAVKATGIAFALLLGFFYVGDGMLRLFQVSSRISSGREPPRSRLVSSSVSLKCSFSRRCLAFNSAQRLYTRYR